MIPLMDVRLAETEDLARCASLSPGVQSTHAWQLRLAYDPIAAQPGDELGATLHRTRLPRPITTGPGNAEPLELLWSRAADVLVAEDAQGIGGYLVLTLSHDAPSVTIARLVVAPVARRAGVGGLLLRAAMQWGQAMQLELLVAHCAARNDPAVNFYIRYGMRFSGYSEAFYPRGEIALFWRRAL